MTATRALAFTSTHRMIDRVHGNAANTGPFTEPPGATGFTELAAFILAISDLSNTGTAALMKLAHFTGRQPDEHISALFRHQLRGCPGTPDKLTTFADLHFDVVDNGTQRNIHHGQAVTGLNIDIVSSDDLISDCDAVRCQNIFLLTVKIAEQRDVGRSVWIVFDRNDFGGNIHFIAFEIDNPELPLMSASTMT